MQFDLVHRRYDACNACDALQVIDCEVRDVDRPHAPPFSRLDEGTPRIDTGLALGSGLALTCPSRGCAQEDSLARLVPE